jgi:hypothetical protein
MARQYEREFLIVDEEDRERSTGQLVRGHGADASAWRARVAESIVALMTVVAEVLLAELAELSVRSLEVFRAAPPFSDHVGRTDDSGIGVLRNSRARVAQFRRWRGIPKYFALARGQRLIWLSRGRAAAVDQRGDEVIGHGR